MLLDYERCWLDYRARLLDKRSWGQDELIRVMAEVERDSRVEDTGHDPSPKRTAAPSEATTEAPSEPSGMPDLPDPLDAEEAPYGRSNERTPAGV